MKHFWMALLLLNPLPLLGQGGPTEDPAFWHGLRETIPAEGAITARFSEKRTHPIRPRPLFLDGTLCFRPAKGLKLAYNNLVGSTLFVSREGITRSTGGEAKPIPFPEELVPLRNALLSALELDYDALAESFELNGEHEGETWKLNLTPLHPEAVEPLDRIEIEGEGAFVQTLSIHLGNRRDIVYSLSEHQRLDAAAAAKSCAFDE